jgi:HD-like signal output (HDOD) protein
VLRLAYSAALGRKQPIHSVRHAIALIGVGAMRRFALGMSLSYLFSRFQTPSGFSVTRFNLHSVATATLVEVLAYELPVHHIENAFISGLLHDVGKMLIAVSLPREYETILSLAAVSNMSLVECERHILGTDHAELSGIAITRWELAEPVRWVGYYHHEPERAQELEGSGAKVGLSTLVNRADAFVNYIGMSVLPPTAQPAQAPNLDFAGFHHDQARTLQRFEMEWKRLGDMFR